MSQQIGYISQIIGPVVDVHFPLDGRPAEEVLPTHPRCTGSTTPPMAAHS